MAIQLNIKHARLKGFTKSHKHLTMMYFCDLNNTRGIFSFSFFSNCHFLSVSSLNECHSHTSGHFIKLRKFRKFSGHFDGKRGHYSLINEDKENYLTNKV